MGKSCNDGYGEFVFKFLKFSDYPYPTDFMGNVPGWPVNVACESLNKTFGQLELLDAIHNGILLILNPLSEILQPHRCTTTQPVT